MRMARETRGYTREKFSEICGISVSFLADVELGKKSPSTQTLQKICTSVNISPNYVVLGEVSDTDMAVITDMLKQIDEPYFDSVKKILGELINIINS